MVGINRKNKLKRMKKNKQKVSERIVVDKKKQEEQEELLEQIYSVSINNEFDTQDLTTFYHKKRSVWKQVLFYFVFVLFMVILSSLAGYFYFNWEDPFDGNKVLFNIQVKDNITAGEIFEMKLAYNNLANVPLNQGKVTMQFPENFVLLESVPAASNDAHNAWELPVVPAQSIGEILLKGYFSFDEGENENSYEEFSANFYYYPDNFNSLFKMDSQKNLNLIKPKLSVEVEGESSLKLKETAEFKIYFENLEDKDLSGLSLKANVPNTFVLTEAGPALREQKKYDTFTELFWTLGDLPKGAKKYVSLTGYFEESQSLSDNVIYGEIYTEDDNLDKVILSADSLPLEIQSGTLLLTLKVNDALNKQHLDNQEELTYSLFYKNLSDLTLEDISIDLMVDDFVSKDPLIHLLNWNTASDDYEGSVSRTEGGAKINWDVNNIAELSELSPGEEGEIIFTIDKYANSKFAGINAWRDFIVNNYFVLSYNLEDSENSIEVKSNVIYTNYQQLLNLETKDFEVLGQASTEANLYKLLYEVGFAEDEADYYNLEFRFKPKDGVDWIDLHGDDAPEGTEALSEGIAYSQFYDNMNNNIVVKFPDLSQCNEVCAFSIVLESDKQCSGQECLFDDYYGSVWLNNEIMRYNP